MLSAADFFLGGRDERSEKAPVFAEAMPGLGGIYICDCAGTRELADEAASCVI